MNAHSRPDRDEAIEVGILVLEDNIDLRDMIVEGVIAATNALPSEYPCIYDCMPSIRKKFVVKSTDNLEEAREIVNNNLADIMLADCRVKKRATSEKEDADIRTLLQHIKSKRAFIRVFGHTAHSDIITSFERDKLWSDSFNKREINSEEKLVIVGSSEAHRLMKFRLDISSSFLKLLQSIEEPDIFAANALFREGRRAFSGVVVPDGAPEDYGRTLFLLGAILHRMSLIPSESLGIKAFDRHFAEEVRKVLHSVGGAFHSYLNETLPLMASLEAEGYPILMRFGDD